MVSARAEDEVTMIPVYILVLLIPVFAITTMCWASYKERRDRRRDQERERMARNMFGGDVELENFANNRRRSGFPFAWIRAIVCS